jgi:uncharacterized protein
MHKPPPLVRCPACGGKSLFAADNPWRPFCCQRCKQIDLGAWASEQFRVERKLEALDPSSIADLRDASNTLH